MQEKPPFVGDTSVLVAFSGVGQMTLLREITGRIAIPSAVRRELVDDGAGWIAAREAQEIVVRGDWISTVHLAEASIQMMDDLNLDPGEREVISLAAAWQCTPLIDEKTGRRAAELIGLRPLGTLGLLRVAKASGRIEKVAPLLSSMIRQSNLRFSKRLLQKFLRHIGERCPLNEEQHSNREYMQSGPIEAEFRVQALRFLNQSALG